MMAGRGGAWLTILAAFVAGLAAATHPVRGEQLNPAEAVCTGRQAASAERRIEACSSLIASGTFNGDQLAILYTSRGSAWRAKGEFDRALADQNEAIRLQPSSAILYFNRAVIWRSKGDASRAITDFNEAIRLAPNFAIAYKGRGDQFYAKGDYYPAVQDYDVAVQLQPDYAEALARRGLAKLMMGDVDGRNADMTAAHSADAAVVAGLLGPRGFAGAFGEGFLVRKKLKVFTALELSGATICAETDGGVASKLKSYFDRHGMRLILAEFPTFEAALTAYNAKRCDVLAASLPALRASRPKLAEPDQQALLPEVFAAPQSATEQVIKPETPLAKDREGVQAAPPPIAPSPPSANAAPECGWFAIIFCSQIESEALSISSAHGARTIDTNSSAYPNFRKGWYCSGYGPMQKSAAEARAASARASFATAYIKNSCR
jgi:Flp pilus assembly protein TadD